MARVTKAARARAKAAKERERLRKLAERREKERKRRARIKREEREHARFEKLVRVTWEKQLATNAALRAERQQKRVAQAEETLRLVKEDAKRDAARARRFEREAEKVKHAPDRDAGVELHELLEIQTKRRERAVLASASRKIREHVAHKLDAFLVMRDEGGFEPGESRRIYREWLQSKRMAKDAIGREAFRRVIARSLDDIDYDYDDYTLDALVDSPDTED